MGPKDFRAVSIHVDPLDKYPNVDPRRLLDVAGILPHWATQAPRHDDCFQTALEKLYGFPSIPMTGGEVKPDGTYLYPGDPPMHPVASMTVEGVPGTVFFYQYSIVAVVKEDSTWVCRMD